MTPTHELDRPVWHALSGPHAPLAERQGRAARYRATVAPFAALPPDAELRDWEDLAAVAGDDALALFGVPHEVPAGWEELARFPVVQMTVPEGFGRPHKQLVRLGAEDAAAMVALVAETQPGPFLPETYRCGAYWGVREGDTLVAMAGERLTTGHWTEISAVCTRASHRGQGLATALMEHVAHGIRAAGRTPFLHTGASNTAALGLYARLGFPQRECDNMVQRIQVAGATPAETFPHA